MKRAALVLVLALPGCAMTARIDYTFLRDKPEGGDTPAPGVVVNTSAHIGDRIEARAEARPGETKRARPFRDAP